LRRRQIRSLSDRPASASARSASRTTSYGAIISCGRQVEVHCGGLPLARRILPRRQKSGPNPDNDKRHRQGDDEGCGGSPATVTEKIDTIYHEVDGFGTLLVPTRPRRPPRKIARRHLLHAGDLGVGGRHHQEHRPDHRRDQRRHYRDRGGGGGAGRGDARDRPQRSARRRRHSRGFQQHRLRLAGHWSPPCHASWWHSGTRWHDPLQSSVLLSAVPKSA
jgi:hypothetical protein